MSSNNNLSFLQMIGMEPKPSSDETSQRTEPDHEVRENTPALNDHVEMSSTGSATEWQIEAESSRTDPVYENAQHEDPLAISHVTRNSKIFELGSDLEVEMPPEEVSVSAEHFDVVHEALENFENFQTSTPIERIEKVEQTEALDPFEKTKTEILSSADANSQPERTMVYNEQDYELLKSERELSKVVEEHSEVLLSKSIRSISVDENSRATLPMDYEEINRSSSRTAHFEYSREAPEDHSGGRIVVLEGNTDSKAFHLGKLPLRLGRDDANDVVLNDSNVSRFHAEIREVEGKLLIVDLGSTNGIKVNGAVVGEAELKSHDVISVGEALFEYLPAGVISRGVPHAMAMDTASLDNQSPRPPRRINIARLALGAFVVLGIFIFYLSMNKDKVIKSVQQQGQQIVAKKLESEADNFRQQTEKKYQKSFKDLDPKIIHQEFIENLEQSSIAAVVPKASKDQLKNLPPEILKVVLENPEVISTALKNGLTVEALSQGLAAQLSNLVSQKRYLDAYQLAQYLSAINPQNDSYKQTMQVLKEKYGVKVADSGTSANAEAVKLYHSYLDEYEGKLIDLMQKGSNAEALEFAKLVRFRIGLLLEKDPSFKEIVPPDVEKWEQRIAELTKVISKTKKKHKEPPARPVGEIEEEKLIEQIKLHMNFSEPVKAEAEIQEFFTKYPTSPRVAEVQSMKDELEKILEKSFETTKQNVERFVQTESYQSAWTELYHFLDVAPQSSFALALKEKLTKIAEPRATQYYNQARVYEFEADDLVAAEQYYRRTLDVADPKSDLFAKASRRVDEVRRKSIQ